MAFVKGISVCSASTWNRWRWTMPRRHLIGFLVLLSTLTPSEAIIKLNSIQDLKSIAFGQSVPAHSLVLLHWFANMIELNYDGAIELPFSPENGNHGTHRFGDYEHRLNLPHGPQYYTLGNLKNSQKDTLLSHYNAVSGRLHNQMHSEELNMGRILFSIRSNTIERVYITQHDQEGTTYDPMHTYEITANLLRELREFSLDRHYWLSDIRDRFGYNISNHQLNSLRDTWGELACLGLLVFILTGNINLRFAPQKSCLQSKHQGFYTPNYTPTDGYNDQVYRHIPEEPNILMIIIKIIIIIMVVIIALVIIGMSKKNV